VNTSATSKDPKVDPRSRTLRVVLSPRASHVDEFCAPARTGIHVSIHPSFVGDARTTGKVFAMERSCPESRRDGSELRMSEHVTSTKPHQCWRGPACATQLEVHCTCGWAQGAGNGEHAEALQQGHRLTPTDPVIAWQPRAVVDDDELRDLFAQHCACRPLQLDRSSDDHAACHDCDTAILHDVQIALGIVLLSDAQAWQDARARCVARIHDSRSHVNRKPAGER